MPKQHGYAKIYIGKTEHYISLDRIVDAVCKMIHFGFVLQCEKTKSARTDNLNGKNWVTVGPYQTANKLDKLRFPYAVYIKNECFYHERAVDAARDYVAWVGRDIARESIREYCRKNF